MLFLAIFASLLAVYFGIVDPSLKRRKAGINTLKVLPVFEAIGVIVDLMKF